MSGKKNFRKFRHNNSRQSLPFEKIELIEQPHPVCTICSKPISYITEGLVSKDSDGYVHFDCAIKQIAEKYDVKPPLKVSYIGSGKFGIIEYIKMPNSFKIKETIEWESPDKLKKIKEEVESLKK